MKHRWPIVVLSVVVVLLMAYTAMLVHVSDDHEARLAALERAD